MFKKLVSYLFPLNILKQKSTISQTLEVTLVNGELVLDSKNTNYSYGSLQRILRKGLRHIGFEKIKTMNHILVLGVAGGSVIKTLINEIDFTGKITGVEIDKDIIEIANTYFHLDKIQNLEIVINDALGFVMETQEKYDLIIIDIFEDTTMPDFLYGSFFVNRLHSILNTGGFILFNTMVLNGQQKHLNSDFINAFDTAKYKVTKLNKVEIFNELIIIENTSL